MTWSDVKSLPSPGFNYSAALKAMNGTWTFDALNKWLTDPRAKVPGTAMTFAGLANEKQRADVIAYLDTLSKNPVPLPKAAENAPQTRQPPRPPARRRAAHPPLLPRNSAARLRFDRPAHADVNCISSRRRRHAGAAIEKYIISAIRSRVREDKRNLLEHRGEPPNPTYIRPACAWRRAASASRLDRSGERAGEAQEKVWRHGVSLFGDLKYPAGFKQFDYVNAAAPKGGAVREIALGTYDNFNIGRRRRQRHDRRPAIDFIYDTLLTPALDEVSSRVRTARRGRQLCGRLFLGHPIGCAPKQNGTTASR